MSREGDPPIQPPEQRERSQVGDLHFLWHPGTADTFSGYGLATGEGRGNHLVGLLMVDRPQPVDPKWLARIEEVYGEYQLVPMTAGGERGIACQMWVAADSLPFLRRWPEAGEFQAALQPLLDARPNPTLEGALERQAEPLAERVLDRPA